jgi:hypothetical protein
MILTNEEIIALRKTTASKTFEPYADTLAFARAIEKAITEKLSKNLENKGV